MGFTWRRFIHFWNLPLVIIMICSPYITVVGCGRPRSAQDWAIIIRNAHALASWVWGKDPQTNLRILNLSLIQRHPAVPQLTVSKVSPSVVWNLSSHFPMYRFSTRAYLCYILLVAWTCKNGKWVLKARKTWSGKMQVINLEVLLFSRIDTYQLENQNLFCSLNI